MASSWNLPKELCLLILQHHEVGYLSDIVGNKEQLAFAILKAAEHLVERVKRHNVSPDWEEIKKRLLMF